jgi:nucleoside-diphosphate-sugar epimerase
MSQRATSPETAGRVLVTGGTGFIGRHVLVPLLDAGYEVHLITRNEPVVPAEVTVHRADLLVPGAGERVVESVRPSHLLHMAWFVAPGQVWNSFENLRWVEASLELLRGFARVDGRRVVLAGTCSEYDPRDEPCRERGTPTEPDTVYGASKDALRRMAELVAREAGFSLAWARIFLAFGPHEHPARLVAFVTRNLLLGQPAPCSHGRQVRDFLHTPEIAGALVTLLGSGVTGVVNVASGRTVTIGHIVRHIGNRLERSELIRFGEVIPPAHEPPVLTADVERLRGEVGWRPSRTLEEGLDATIAWWKAQLTVRSPG